MASLALRSADRVLRRSISDFARKTKPTKHSSSEFNMGHGKHIQQEKSTCQPSRMDTSIMTKVDSISMKVDELNGILRGAREDVKAMLQQRRADEAWDKLQKKVILPSLGAVGLAIWANKMLFGESRQEKPEEIKPLN